MFLPWKPQAEFCCTSNVTAGPSTESSGCPCAPALRRDPPVHPPQSGSPRDARFSAGPVRSCSDSRWLWRTGMRRRAAWTVCSCSGLREYASQQIYKWDPVESSDTRRSRVSFKSVAVGPEHSFVTVWFVSASHTGCKSVKMRLAFPLT